MRKEDNVDELRLATRMEASLLEMQAILFNGRAMRRTFPREAEKAFEAVTDLLSRAVDRRERIERDVRAGVIE